MSNQNQQQPQQNPVKLTLREFSRLWAIKNKEDQDRSLYRVRKWAQVGTLPTTRENGRILATVNPLTWQPPSQAPAGHVSIDDAARILGVTRTAVQYRMDRPRSKPNYLPSVKIDGRVWVKLPREKE